MYESVGIVVMQVRHVHECVEAERLQHTHLLTSKVATARNEERMWAECARGCPLLMAREVHARESGNA